PVEQRLALARVFPSAGRRLHRELVDVGAGHERLLTRAGQHDHPDVVSSGRVGKRGTQLGNRGRVERVQDLRSVDGDDHDDAILLSQQVFVGHNLKSMARTYRKTAYISQPAAYAPTMNAPNTRTPSFSWSRGASRISAPNTAPTQAAKITSRPRCEV